ncbi:MAG: response regulator transcription factor [Meiothermus sp.]|nr:response regulator transcription factor [Meiothermus sp.]
MALITLAVMSEKPLLRLGLGALLAAVPGLEVLLEGADYRQAQILLVDSALPGLETLLEQGRTAPFRPLVVAPEDNVVEAEHLLHRGAWGYVPLTSPLPELVECVLEVVRGEVGLPARLSRQLLSRMARAAPQAPQATLEPLSEREREILSLLCQGRSNKAIAQKLYLSVRTVEGHLANLYAKLGVNSRTQAALAGLALRPGEAPPR